MISKLGLARLEWIALGAVTFVGLWGIAKALGFLEREDA